MCAHPVTADSPIRSTASARCGETAVEQLAKARGDEVSASSSQTPLYRCLADAGHEREAGGASRCHSISRRHERRCELRFDVELPARSQQGVRRRAAAQLLCEHRRAVDGRFDQRREARSFDNLLRVGAGGHGRAMEAGVARELQVTPRPRERAQPARVQGVAAANAASGSRVRAPSRNPGGSSGSPSDSVIPRLARKSRTPSSRGRAWRCV